MKQQMNRGRGNGNRPLAVRRETVRRLSSADLTGVAGGAMTDGAVTDEDGTSGCPLPPRMGGRASREALCGGFTFTDTVYPADWDQFGLKMKG